MDAIVDLNGFKADRVRAVRCDKCNQRLDTTELKPLEKVPCPGCGYPLYVPVRVGEFLLMRHLGRGGMGSVYGAWDPLLHRAVAIKVMLPPEGQPMPDWANLEGEARSAAQLNHPHVAQVYNFGYHMKQPYLVMELVRGRQLDEFIVPGEPMDARFLFGVALQVADGLNQAAERNLLHSDIKPENIMIAPKGGAKVVDFGLAGTAGTGSAAGGKIVWGSPYYVAPERLQRKPATIRSDMYSLGATLYHALTGKTPFTGDNPKDVMMARLSRTPEPLRTLRPDLPVEAEALISRMMALEPGRRHPTYASLLGDIRRLLEIMGGEIDVSEFAARRFGGTTGGGAAGTSRSKAISRSLLRNSAASRRASGGLRTQSTASVTVTGEVATSGTPWKLIVGIAAAVVLLVGAIAFAVWAMKQQSEASAAVPPAGSAAATR